MRLRWLTLAAALGVALPLDAAWTRPEQSGRPLPNIEAPLPATNGSGPTKSGEPPQTSITSLLATYKQLHEAPELSHFEKNTSAFLAAQLRAAGYEVTDHLGKYDNPVEALGRRPEPGGRLLPSIEARPPATNGSGPTKSGEPPWQGYGIIGVMKNGPGPVLMVRSELDALPVTEETGLPYASRTPGVMHACGHDLHMTVLLGTARTLAQDRSAWHGTLVILYQPAEETINGAKAMLADGLYQRIPRPDMVIALHDNAELAAGQVATTSGYAMASATSVSVTLHGVSAHGSLPERSKDPVVAAAELVLALQTIVSRETSPFDQAVVTVGSIQAGTKNNIIPDSATLLLTIRTYKEEVRQRILASIQRMANGIALADGLPANQPPEVKTYEYTPSLYNDPKLTAKLAAIFTRTLGADNVAQMPPVMASEDFGAYGLSGHQIPVSMFWLGAVDPAKVAASEQSGTPLPSLHSSHFAPLPEPAIATGVKLMTAAVLGLMGASQN